MPFEIISLKQCGAGLKVIFDILGNSSEIIKIVVNVHDLAFITFCKKEDYIFIQVKKTELAKDLTITLQCSKDVDNPIQLTCLEEWSEWKSLSYISNKTVPFIVNVRLTIKMVNSPLLVILNKDTSFTDFELMADNGTVAVHKSVLAAHSDLSMFRTMLLGDWKETREGKIELEGITRETLQHFKDYIYLGTLPDVGLQPLLLLAMRYMVDALKAQILFKISMTVTEDNLHDLLNFAIEHECYELLHNILQKTPDKILVAAFNKKRPIPTEHVTLPRNRVRKTSIGLHTEEQMRNALELISNGQKIRAVAKSTCIP